MHKILRSQLVGVVASFDIGFVIRKFQCIFLILECVLSSKLSTYKGQIQVEGFIHMLVFENIYIHKI